MLITRICGWLNETTPPADFLVYQQKYLAEKEQAYILNTLLYINRNITDNLRDNEIVILIAKIILSLAKKQWHTNILSDLRLLKIKTLSYLQKSIGPEEIDACFEQMFAWIAQSQKKRTNTAAEVEEKNIEIKAFVTEFKNCKKGTVIRPLKSNQICIQEKNQIVISQNENRPANRYHIDLDQYLDNFLTANIIETDFNQDLFNDIRALKTLTPLILKGKDLLNFNLKLAKVYSYLDYDEEVLKLEKSGNKKEIPQAKSLIYDEQTRLALKTEIEQLMYPKEPHKLKLISELNKYIRYRLAKAKKHQKASLADNYNTVFGKMFGHSAETKISAAQKLLCLLCGDNQVHLLSNEISAMTEDGSTLAKLLTLYMSALPTEVKHYFEDLNQILDHYDRQWSS